MKLQFSTHNVLRPHHIRAAVVEATRSLSGAPTLVHRATASSASSTSSGQTPAEEESEDNLIIGITVAVPIALAIVVLFFLHRRIKRKQRQEDNDFKHKSLDFGMEEVVPNKKGRKGRQSRVPKLPEMTITDLEKSTMHEMKSHRKGLSMDMNSPYLLPAVLNDSRESFHSMSRGFRDGDDPYRPVSMFRTNTNNGSLHSVSHSRPARAPRYDNDSVYTASSLPSADVPNASLLRNAQRMSVSNPFGDSNATSPASERGLQYDQQPSPFEQRQHAPLPAPPLVQVTEPEHSYQPYSSRPVQMYQPHHDAPPPPPAHQQSHRAAAAGLSIAVPPAAEYQPQYQPQYDAPVASQDQQFAMPEASSFQPLNRRVSVMGLRPLPPDDPAEDPESRANRIRSFYKEYFDDSKPNPTGYYPQYNPYQDEYEAEFYEEGAYYDPQTDSFLPVGRPVAPFAQPQMGRRAMTPDLGGSKNRRMRSNTASMQSTGHIDNRAFRGPRGSAKRPLPPPAALRCLPTPSKLQGSDSAFLTANEFAPARTFRDQQLGRGPDSPLGGSRPYNKPAVRAFNPLVKSFDDLAALPSAHHLRKSGTFSSLDFAPPPRFRNQEGTGSDAGSIRSNRSGISQVQAQAIRAGAYRVSRLPHQMVGTRDDFAVALKPTWELRGATPATT